MKNITVTVEFTAVVPDHIKQDDLDVLTCQIPIEQMRLDTDEGIIGESRVTGYKTEWVEFGT